MALVSALHLLIQPAQFATTSFRAQACDVKNFLWTQSAHQTLNAL
ncbi:hypothetical protein AAHH84_00175 [Candidatus Hodgkinia cicadicola]